MTEDLALKNLMVKYNVLVDGKSKTITQIFKNTKLTATSEDLFAIGSKIAPLVNGTSLEIFKIEHYSLAE